MTCHRPHALQGKKCLEFRSSHFNAHFIYSLARKCLFLPGCHQAHGSSLTQNYANQDFVHRSCFESGSPRFLSSLYCNSKQLRPTLIISTSMTYKQVKFNMFTPVITISPHPPSSTLAWTCSSTFTCWDPYFSEWSPCHPRRVPPSPS